MSIRLTTLRQGAGWIAVALAAGPALLGAVLLGMRIAGTGDTATHPPAVAPDLPPVAIFARQLCTFTNDDARAALIDGADGGLTVTVGGRTWWLFGDTLFVAASGKQIEQNTIAWSRELRPDGCPRLQYHTHDGIAVPFIEKDGSLTVWPVGAWPVDDRSFDMYVAYVYGSGPFGYWIGEVGVARVDTTTMATEVTARRLWDADTGFPQTPIGALPIAVDEDDGLLRVAVQTEHGLRYLARVDAARLADAASYEFWDGDGWSPSPADAVPMWTVPEARDHIERLATFDNGASFAWNEHLGKWLAVHNVGYAEIGARTADRLEGPWSDPVTWIDCLDFAEVRIPTCYSPFQQPALARDGGRTIFIAFTQMDVYDTIGWEVTLGAPVHEYRRGSDVVYAHAPPGDGWSDEGVAFTAGDVPLPGLVAVYRWRTDDGVSRYAAVSPGPGFTPDTAAAFFAAPSEHIDGSSLTYRPIYDWRRGNEQLLSPLHTGLERYGYERTGVAFYAP